MPAVSITYDDLVPFAPDLDQVKAVAMIDDALARAALVAPCITADEFAYAAAAKAIIRGAILRWHESGTGALQTESVGPFSVGMDTRTTRKGMFLASELDELKSLCATSSGKAFSIDTLPEAATAAHVDVCSLNLGAAYCSCGADLTLGWPLYEGG